MVSTKVYSFSTICKEERVTIIEGELELDNLQGYVTCVYNKEWWIACVLEVNEDKREVKVSFLHPQGPSRSFRYPAQSDILSIPVADVLTKVDPRTATGHTYRITQKESHAATEKLQNYLHKS